MGDIDSSSFSIIAAAKPELRTSKTIGHRNYYPACTTDEKYQFENKQCLMLHNEAPHRQIWTQPLYFNLQSLLSVVLPPLFFLPLPCLTFVPAFTFLFERIHHASFSIVKVNRDMGKPSFSWSLLLLRHIGELLILVFLFKL